MKQYNINCEDIVPVVPCSHWTNCGKINGGCCDLWGKDKLVIDAAKHMLEEDRDYPSIPCCIKACQKYDGDYENRIKLIESVDTKIWSGKSQVAQLREAIKEKMGCCGKAPASRKT